MEDKKEYYENLCNKYKELKRKTELEAHDVKPGGKIEAKYIDTKDMQEIEKVEKELEKCLDSLPDDQLKELRSDNRFSYKVTKIITERKIKKSKIN